MNMVKFLGRSLILFVLLSVLILVQQPAPTDAQSGYTLDWWTVDGGGVVPSSGTGYSLGGTLGQPDAATWSHGQYTLSGGFWHDAQGSYELYLPLILRSFDA